MVGLQKALVHMNAKQISILNALVTFAAENMGHGVGMTEEEREVAQIVGEWALTGRVLDPRLARIFDEASGALGCDAGALINLIEEIEKEAEENGEQLPPAQQTHAYKLVNSSGYGGSFEKACNHWAEMGWRVVGVVSDTRPGYAHTIVLERPVGVSHPNDT